MPGDGIGNQVAHVGFFRPVSGSFFAVQVHFGLGKGQTVLPVNVGNDPFRGNVGFDILSLKGVQTVAQAGGQQEVILDGLALVIDDHDAHVFELGAGGLDGLPVLPRGHDGVAVAVQQQIRAGDFAPQVGGPVAVLLAFHINAQMRQADDHIRVFQVVDGFLGGFIQLFKGGKGNHIDQTGVDLGDGFRRVDAEETDLQSAGGGDHLGGGQNGFSGFVQRDVGADHGEIRLGQILHQLFIAVVKFMIAQGDHVVTRGVHHFDGAFTLACADIDGALGEVAYVRQDHRGPETLETVTETGNIGIAVQLPVNVVGMQENGLSGVIARDHGADIGGGCVLLFGPVRVLREDGGEAQYHAQGKNQTEKLFHFWSSPFRAGQNSQKWTPGLTPGSV